MQLATTLRTGGPTRPRRRNEGGGNGEDGVGLIDAILALVVLLVVLVASSSLVADVAKQAAHAKERVSATEIAEQWLERLANDPLATLQSDINHNVALTSTPDVIAGVGYSAIAHLAWADTGATQNACTSGNPPQVVLATVTVTWGVSQTLAETTVIDPPYGTAVPTDGYISVQVIGATGSSPPAGVTNLTVSINGSTYTPDDNGCVFQQETPGTYAVSLTSSAGGYVDWQENAAPSTSLSVVAGATAPYSFHYDQAATVTFTSGSSPVAVGLPVAAGNGQLLPVPWKTIITAGSSATSANVFPYQSGYTVWYGDCVAEEPTSAALVSVTPGGSSSATVTGLAPIELQVKTTSGSPMYNATAAAVVNDSADSCAADSFVLVASSGTSPNPAISLTQVPPETYTVTVTDPANGHTTAISAQVSTSAVTVSGTTYPDGTPVPVTVS